MGMVGSPACSWREGKCTWHIPAELREGGVGWGGGGGEGRAGYDVGKVEKEEIVEHTGGDGQSG